MKKIRDYTSIWSVEKVFYAMQDINLPLPLTFSQICWFLGTLGFMILTKNLPPFSFIDAFLLRYIAIPAAVTWLMSQKTFDGKKPYSFIIGMARYLLRPKKSYAGKPVHFKREQTAHAITTVRSELYHATISD